ncbi:MAG TPA: Hpt domain-containing protein [Gemmatimonadaceae bacterium]|jgi:HPt (histidine-containing phosphotransfer) domain-containing protein|nr:Hpt domain-containing protein [Gemmatimonadaceae bacterium]
MSDGEMIDHGAFGALSEIAGGDSGFVSEMIDAFLVEASDLLKMMRDAVAHEDATVLRRAAHSLKSSSAMFGVTTVAERCRRLEELSKAEWFAGADVLIAECQWEYDRAIEELIRLRPEG